MNNISTEELTSIDTRKQEFKDKGYMAKEPTSLGKQYKVCNLCGMEERGNLGHNINYLMCSGCVQRLLATPDELIREGIKKLREKGMMQKAQMLENFIGKEKKDVREVKKFGKERTNLGSYRRRSSYRRRPVSIT